MFLLTPMLAPLLVMFLFFLFSKVTKNDIYSNSSFECGFSSYFFSRFSFSIQYYFVGLLFLFLDLELCSLMPFIIEGFSTSKVTNLAVIFVSALLCSLILEWANKELEWKI